MSNMKDFFEKLQNDETMQGELTRAKMDATIAVAGKYGFAITESDFKAMSENLSEEDLAAVVGGIWPRITDFLMLSVGNKERAQRGAESLLRIGAALRGEYR